LRCRRTERSARLQDRASGFTHRGIHGLAYKDGRAAYVTQHFGGAMLDYQNGHMAGADTTSEKLTGRRSMILGEFAKLHADQLNAS